MNNLENKWSVVKRENVNHVFLNLEINELNSREAMGLGEEYSPSSLDDLTDKFSTLISDEVQSLTNTVSSEEAPFLDRMAAGSLLALKGDPRIKTLDPEMIEIDAWEGQLGLSSKDVETVLDEYKVYGVLEDWIQKETPEYKVKLEAFKIGKYLVTNQEYLDFLIDSGFKEIPTSWPFGQFVQYYANHPVSTLSDEACLAYAEWLSKKTNREFRLPTESEWEYAASGPEKREFPWGNEFQVDCCNTVESGILQTTPVGLFPKGKSFFGCEDMAGNVEEYVSDYYNPYPNGKVIVDDLAVKNGKFRVARGGSFTRFRDLARCKRRHGRYLKDIYIMGFRLVEDLKK